MIGKTLAHYEITSQVGKGGMGEVYQATDKKLGRDVAIKVLPEEFARDADRVARFQREAKLLASLNHPNIASIYGLEEADGTNFLVMELVEGNTLDDRIKSGMIPVEEALKLALQIAEALEAAHEKGVIHRDLKPANIKVTPDGKVKVLDFGLAKAFAGEQADLNLSNSPTLSVAATQQGVILGTAAYMSPEQARGKEVNKRADIWAFGVVLFEMLTGKQVFTGDTVSDTLASVLAREPEWDSLPANLHSRIRLLMERCLRKEPTNRYRDIGDARVDIQEVLDDPSGVFVQPPTAAEGRAGQRTILPWAMAIIGIIIVGAAIWLLKPTPPPEPRQVIRSEYALPEDQQFNRIGETLVAVSADGTKIVYQANRQLYLRYLKEKYALPIQGTDEDPASPFFSPNGEWIGYYSFDDKQWKKIPITGGTSTRLCNAPDPHGATWTEDDTILFGQRDGRRIMRIPGSGGDAEVVIEAGEGEGVYGPQVLPGGEWVLFTLTTSVYPGSPRWDEAQIAVQSLKTEDRKILSIHGSDARYVPTGHIVYAQSNDLRAVAFDFENMEVKGDSKPIVEGVRRDTQVTGTAHYGFSGKGMLVNVPTANTTSSQLYDLVWVNHDGDEEAIDFRPDNYQNLKISPDGTKLALTIYDNYNRDIWILDLTDEDKDPMRLTWEDGDDGYPFWTLDSKSIVFSSDRDGKSGLFLKAADGRGSAEILCSGPATLAPYSWADHGKTLLISSIENQRRNIAILPMEADGAGECKPLLNVENELHHPRISPDGEWMAYTSNETGQWEVFVSLYPDIDEGKWSISTNGGQDPIWHPTRQELYYRSDNAVMAVEYKTDPNFEKVRTRLLSNGLYAFGRVSQWDISHDGEQFLMIKDVSTAGAQPIIDITLNWFEELKKKVPVP